MSTPDAPPGGWQASCAEDWSPDCDPDTCCALAQHTDVVTMETTSKPTTDDDLSPSSTTTITNPHPVTTNISPTSPPGSASLTAVSGTAGCVSAPATRPPKLHDDYQVTLPHPDDNRFSKVIESLPLIYLPHTRQLVPQSSAPVQRPDQDQQSASSLDLDAVDVLSDIPPHITFHKGPDSCSLTNLSSISSDYSLSALGDDLLDLQLRSSDLDLDDPNRLMDVNLHSRNTFEKSNTIRSLDSGIDTNGAKNTNTKRRGLTHLARTFFSRKSSSKDKLSVVPAVTNTPGWRLFGKVSAEAPEGGPEREPSIHSSTSSIRSWSPCESRRRDVEVSSTSGLVLEDRPDSLPPKPDDEAQKHQQEYEDIVEGIKKKEKTEAKKRKKEHQKQIQKEETIANAVKLWKTEVLPNWSTVRDKDRIRKLWWSGVPSSVRGQVWRLAIGNSLEITSEICQQFLEAAEKRHQILFDQSLPSSKPESEPDNTWRESSAAELISLDVSRTFPSLCIFQKGGPYHDLLLTLLGAYSDFKPDVGYVQGMSFLAAMLLLNMDIEHAFICFANLLHRPCLLAFFRINENLIKSYFLTYEEFFHQNLPKLYCHFRRHNLTPDIYLIDWVYSLFSRSLPLDVASRVWDVFCRDGDEFLFRTALGILKLYEEILMTLDFIHLAQFLTKLPDTVAANQLFDAVQTITMSSEKRTFMSVFESLRESLESR